MLIAVTLILAGCAEVDTGDKNKLQIASSFTMITDIAEAIGGEHVEVHNLVPSGMDPHEYEPKPIDVRKVSESDIVFAFGLNLEGVRTVGSRNLCVLLSSMNRNSTKLVKQ